MITHTDTMNKALSELWQAGYKAGYKAAFKDIDDTKVRLEIMLERIDTCKSKEATI